MGERHEYKNRTQLKGRLHFLYKGADHTLTPKHPVFMLHLQLKRKSSDHTIFLLHKQPLSLITSYSLLRAAYRSVRASYGLKNILLLRFDNVWKIKRMDGGFPGRTTRGAMSGDGLTFLSGPCHGTLQDPDRRELISQRARH